MVEPNSTTAKNITRGASSRPDRTRHTSSALEDLSKVAMDFQSTERTPRPPILGRGMTLAAISAVLVGAILVFSGGFRYICTATLRLDGTAAPQHIEEYRSSLLEHVWRSFADKQADQQLVSRWWIATEKPDLLKLAVTVTDRRTGLESVRSIARDYVTHMHNEARRARETPGEAEEALAKFVRKLDERMQAAQQEVEEGIARVPSEDPRGDREQLLERWRSMTAEFQSIRDQLGRERNIVDKLATAPPPAHGIIDADERRTALKADDALQQDLKELHVEIDTLRTQLLAIRNDAQQPLADLKKAAEELADISASTRGGQNDGRLRVSKFVGEGQRYSEDLAEFQKSWDEEFTRLEELPGDPGSSNVLDLYARLRSLLGDFLFQASERLASLRTFSQTMAEGLDDSARNHVLYSNLTRAFQTLQAAHHRFEFTAGAIEPNANFRLDTAQRSAKGLRRRSQARIRNVDAKLEDAARERAREQQLAQLDNARKQIEETRARANKSIEEIVSLQDKLNVNSSLTEEFLAAVLRAEHASNLAELTQQDLGHAQEYITQLREKRLASIEEVELQFVSSTVTSRPVNLPERIRAGGLGALVTFLVVTLLHWWMGRSDEHRARPI